jgi:endonuclease-3
MQASSELRARALVVHERLCAEYGCPIPYFHDLDPLSELVSSLLSHRTKNRDSGRAFRQLRERFATWEAVRDAPRDWLESLTGVGPKTSAAVLLFSRWR